MSYPYSDLESLFVLEHIYDNRYSLREVAHFVGDVPGSILGETNIKINM